LTDDFRRTVYLRTVQDWIVRPQMKTVPGVAGPDAIGGFVKQYQVQPDPQKPIAYGLMLQQVVSAVEAIACSARAQAVWAHGRSNVPENRARAAVRLGRHAVLSR
jgi:cobalt-zinc-cadmium resistance protein CzcA